jgi:hypothetical protein
MYRGIFNRHQADSKFKRQKRGFSVVPASSEASSPEEAAPRKDMVIDDSVLALSRELSELKQTEVPQGAKERGWASLQREMERSPVRPAVTVGAKSSTGGPGRRANRNWRWALGGGAAAVVAIIATLVATLGGGVPQTVVVNSSTTVASVVSTDSTLPNTTVTTPVVTSGSPNTGSTQSTTPSTDTTSTSGSSTSLTTDHTTVTNHPSTTQPTSTDTTGEQQNAAQQRIVSAVEAARYLAQLVVDGNASGAGSLIASSAQTQLSQMVRSLNQPYDYEPPTGGTILSSYVVRVNLAIKDRIVNDQGETVETVKHFLVRVQVKGGSAQIIAINAGS